jgi:hypothetical protein
MIIYSFMILTLFSLIIDSDCQFKIIIRWLLIADDILIDVIN